MSWIAVRGSQRMESPPVRHPDFRSHDSSRKAKTVRIAVEPLQFSLLSLASDRAIRCASDLESRNLKPILKVKNSKGFTAIRTVVGLAIRIVQFELEGRESPLTLRQEKQYLYFGHLFPCTPAPLPCSTALFLKNSHMAGPVLQEFWLVLRSGVWLSTFVVQALPWG